MGSSHRCQAGVGVGASEVGTFGGQKKKSRTQRGSWEGQKEKVQSGEGTALREWGEEGQMGGVEASLSRGFLSLLATPGPHAPPKGMTQDTHHLGPPAARTRPAKRKGGKVGCRPLPPAVPGERGRGVPGVGAGLEPPAPAPPRAPNVQQERTRTPQAGGSSWPQALGSARAEPRGSVKRRGTLRGPPGEGQGDTPRVREKNRGPPGAEKEPRVPSAVRDD